MRKRGVIVSLAALAVASTLFLIPGSDGASVDASNPCIGAAPVATKHVVVVMFENTSADSSGHVSGAPFVNSLVDKCGHSKVWNDANKTVTGASDGSYNSKPSYAVLTNGQKASVTGIVNDTYTTKTGVDNIYNQLRLAGRNATSYVEGRASGDVCSGGGATSGSYHDPLRYYTNIPNDWCNAHDLDLSKFDPNNLPDFSMILPKNTSNWHDNSIASGDTWLQNFLTPLLNSSAYASGDTKVFFLTDEESPAVNAIVAPSVQPGSLVTPNGNPVSHYAGLRAFEELLGLPLLGDTPQAPSLLNFINGGGTPTTTTTQPTTTTTQPPTTTTTAPPTTTTTAPPTHVSNTLPVRGAFYYPWFPEAWNQQGYNPFTWYNPTLGFYNGSDPAVIDSHIQSMKNAGLDAGIASWWGQGTPTDGRISSLLSRATGGFKWSLYYEPEGSGNPTVSQINSDLTYIQSQYANNPNYLWVNNKPVLFVYGDGTDSCGMTDRWNQANNGRFYLVEKVFSGYKLCASQPDGWHQYAPAVRIDNQSGFSYSISPGFYKRNEATPRLVRDEAAFTTAAQNMVASNAPFQLVTTFNEWGEGSSIEPATEWNNAYVQILHDAINGVVPPTTTTTTIPPTTTTTAPPTTTTTIPPTTTTTTIPPTTTTTTRPVVPPDSPCNVQWKWLIGKQGKYRPGTIPDSNFINAYDAYWESTEQWPVTFAALNNACWFGGSITGTWNENTTSWSTYHHTGALTLKGGTKNFKIKDLFVKNYGDAINIENNNPNFVLDSVEATNIHDDCIQNDYNWYGWIVGGKYECYVGYSARHYTTARNGSNDYVVFYKNLMRLKPTATVYKGTAPGTGGWFKLDSNSPKMVVIDNVFRADQKPNHQDLNAPNKISSCSGNVILWGGSGAFPGKSSWLAKCPDTTIVEGPAAVALWDQAVIANGW